MLLNPLQQLKDIHLPNPISNWPSAPGWIILLVLLLGLFSLGSCYLLRYFSRKKRQRYMLEVLNNVMEHYAYQPDELIAQLNLLLKRFSLIKYPKAQVATLTGKRWLEFLDKTTQTTAFSQGAGKVLLTGPYERAPKTNIKDLKIIIIKWIMQNV